MPDDLYTRARAAWPTLEVEQAEFGAWVAERVGGEAPACGGGG